MNLHHQTNLRVGVIGTGTIGCDHIRRMRDVLSGVDIVGVTDIDLAKAKAAAPQGAKVFATPQDLINADEVEAIVICSWGPAHEEQLLQAIAAKKPVFCEKPLTTTAIEAQRVIEAEVAHGSRLVQLGFMRRFDSDYRQLKAVIDGNSLGAPLIYYSTHRNPSVPAEYFKADNILNDTMVHDADISRWLLGAEVSGVEVRYPRRSSRNKDLPDPVAVLFHMENGVLVHVEISVNIAYAYDIRGEVCCETGIAALPNRPSPVISDQYGMRQTLPQSWRERFIDAYDSEFREWIVAAKHKTATGPSSYDGYAATLIADAALKAAASGTFEKVEMMAKPSLYA